MTILIVCLVAFVALSMLFGFISIVGSALCNLTGCNKPTGPSRHERKMQEIQELLDSVEQMRQDGLLPPKE